MVAADGVAGGSPRPAGTSLRLLSRLDAWANRVYGSRWNPLYQSGALTLLLLAIVLLTGVYLLLFYRLGSPYESVARITDQAWAGRWIRGLHRYASDAALVTAAIHAFRLYAQRRTWGPRALAWVTGVLLVLVILVCGWTGYVMVWDVHGQVLAVEGARFLDALPIFSEPISRSFVGERPLPSAFFFLNLFAHVAVPVGLGLLLWLHVARVARPTLLPPRPLLWGAVAALVALAVLWPVRMDPMADLLRIPGRVPLDVFYGFWLPVTRLMPAWAVWLGGGVAIAGIMLVPRWTRPPEREQPPRSVVHERLCTGCEQCADDCPYDAIAMVTRSDGRPGLVARVDPAVCVSCGICTASCAPMGVGPAGRTGRDQLMAARAFIDSHRPRTGEVVVIGCARSAAGGMTPEAGVHHFGVECAGNVHTAVIEAFTRTDAGVLVAACPSRDCWSREGGVWLHARVYDGREAELKERVDRTRVRVAHAARLEQPVLQRAIAEFRAGLPAVDAASQQSAGIGFDDLDLIALCDSAEPMEEAS